MKKYKVSYSIIAIVVMLILALLFLFGRGDVGGSAKKVGLRIKEL